MNIFELAYNNASDERIIEAIKMLDNIDAKNKDGGTLLHYACSYDRFEVVKFLIESGADVNIKDLVGWTPLREACCFGHFEIVKFLVEHNADVKKEFEFRLKHEDICQIKILTKFGACFL